MSTAGDLYEIPTQAVLDARLQAADRPGEHLWIMAATWKVTEPRAIRAGDGPNFLDRENLMVLVGPGCFKCEREFSNRLARQLLGWEPRVRFTV